MYEELKEEIKLHEGFVPRTYADSLGKRTIGYGHLCVEPEQWDDDKEYTKEELNVVFEKDFNEALKNAEHLIGERSINDTAKEVIIEMVFQLGIGGVGKFKNMWSALDREDYGEASFQMLDSLWAKQTPARAGKLAGKMRSAKEA
jgi:lysozyme|tara:strand:- start:284 stop:718 length:435 start_codon:yes stop_codon:yes gene_type:complete